MPLELNECAHSYWFRMKCQHASVTSGRHTHLEVCMGMGLVAQIMFGFGSGSTDNVRVRVW
jgi:hypothetical protein